MGLTANHNVSHNGHDFKPGDDIPEDIFDHKNGDADLQALIDGGAIAGDADGGLASKSLASLKKMATDRKIEFAKNAGKDVLIAAIEAHDSKGGEGTGEPAAA